VHPGIAPLEFLVGTWRGEGVGGYPTMDGFRFGQEVRFVAGPKPVLAYTSRSWWLGPDAPGRAVGEPLASEVGFWRMQPGGAVEVTLAHPFGISEVFVGQLDETKIDLRENVLIRTRTAREVQRSVRLYGLVEGDLAYAMDMETATTPMSPHLSARLSRVAEG
jgi:THAP4-like, heme-binding beta-barrel domain